MYTKNPVLISRRMPSHALSGWSDAVKSIGSGVFDIFASAEQAKGAANALQQQQQFAMMQQGTILGFQPSTLLLLGGLGVGAYLLLRKKKSA